MSKGERLEHAKIMDKGYFDSKRDDLPDLMPEFSGRKEISILDLSASSRLVTSIIKTGEKDLSEGRQESGKLTGEERRVRVTGFRTGKAAGESIFYDEYLPGEPGLIDPGKLSENTYDFIYMGDLLTRLVDPWSFLAALRRGMKDDGRLLVSIPNMGNYGVIYYLLMGEWKYQDEGIMDRRNLRFFTLAEATKMFGEAGFSIENLSANFSPHHCMIDNMALIVKELGGEQERFRDEAGVCQYLLRLKKEVLDFSLKVEKEDVRYTEAGRLYREGQWKDSLRCYLNILKKDPEDERAILGLGKCFDALGSHEYGLRCFKRLVELYPSAINIIEYAHYHVKLGNHRDVIGISTSFIKENENRISPADYGTLLKIVGNAHIKLGSLDLAEEFYRQALTALPTSHRERGAVFVNMGTVQFEKGNMEKAATCFNQALEYVHSRAKALSGLGMIEMESDIYSAEKFFSRSLDEDITCMASLYSLVQIACQKRRSATAIRYIEKYISARPLDLEMKYTLAGLHLDAGNFNESDRLCNEILAADPGHSNTQKLKKLVLTGESGFHAKDIPDEGINRDNLRIGP